VCPPCKADRQHNESGCHCSCSVWLYYEEIKIPLKTFLIVDGSGSMYHVQENGSLLVRWWSNPTHRQKLVWVGFLYTLYSKEPSGFLYMSISRKGRWPLYSVSTVNWTLEWMLRWLRKFFSSSGPWGQVRNVSSSLHTAPCTHTNLSTYWLLAVPARGSISSVPFPSSEDCSTHLVF